MRCSLRKEALCKRLLSKCGSEFGLRRRVHWVEIERTKRTTKFTISGRKIRPTLWWICIFPCGSVQRFVSCVVTRGAIERQEIPKWRDAPCQVDRYRKCGWH